MTSRGRCCASGPSPTRCASTGERSRAPSAGTRRTSSARAGAELDTWRSAGLLHDFDYERFPDEHPLRGADELRARGYPDELVQAVLGHGDHTGVPRTTDLAHAVYACDEMSGFVIAVTLVRPNRSLDEVDVRTRSTKKMKDKGFARQVPRDQLTKGAEELGVPFDEHVANVIEGLKTVRGDLGL